MTGLATLAPEIGRKHLELLQELVPRLARVAVMGNATNAGNALALKETERAAGALGVHLHYLDVREPKGIEPAFRAAIKERAEALLVLGNQLLNAHRTQVVALAVKSRLPATYTRPEFVDAGGLMTYGTSYHDLARRAATYGDKILKGAKPADLPVEQPVKFELVLNLKTVKELGLTLPPHILFQADEVIK